MRESESEREVNEREMIERKKGKQGRERTPYASYIANCSKFHKPVIFNPLISSNPLLNENLK